jgi:formylglycine-generating enzyme required for sulfatase activity
MMLRRALPGLPVLAMVFFFGCAALAPPAQAPGTADASADAMALIPAGSFEMGSPDGDPDEQPVHEVAVKSFYMDVHEVTNGQYKVFADATARPLPRFWQPELDKANEPVVGVSLFDAQAYAAWAGKRLPTEAEWEYAARGGRAGCAYPWGNSLDNGAANFKSFGILPVMSFPANGFGLYDMAGNVWEWCSDWYSPDFYAVSPAANPTGPVQGALKVLRGGAWYCGPEAVRAANRFYALPDARSFTVGFRCVRDVR